MVDAQTVWEEAAAKAKADCGNPDCRDPARRYTCTYHAGWEDGFDACLTRFKIGESDG